ncbi:MAG: ATP-dependent RecD-like DNA helicase [Acidimicrobiia bacterium]
MRADDRAARATRDPKDKTLTPERLRDRWRAGAEQVGLEPGAAVDNLVIGRQLEPAHTLGEAEICAALVDPATGLCAMQSRFGEAHVVERVAAISGGRLTLEEILTVTKQFLCSEHVVRLTPDVAQRRPAEWSTVELRAVEDRLLAQLDAMTARSCDPTAPSAIDAAIAREPKRLGRDQIEAVRVLCDGGPSVRVLVAPAGFGKTTALHAAATAVASTGSPVVALAPTHKAVAELRAAGLDAQTIARFCHRVRDVPLVADTTVIVDETSQVATRDAAGLLEAIAATPDTRVWFVGDVRQAQPVAAGGLAAELERLAADGLIPAAGLHQNRRQRDPAERAALAKYRAGDIDASQTIRTDHGWEHDLASPTDTRHALADAAVADGDRHGVEHVAVLAVSHADCEDLADAIRAIRVGRGELRGPTLQGPGWGNSRTYAAGDRILVHVNLDVGPERRVCNGSTGTVLAATRHGLNVLIDDGQQVKIDADVVAGRRVDGTPNVSHAWARTVDGAQGGTWRQVHFLATPALDRMTGYVAQSRGQLPTHTWNTRPDRDHPLSLLADDRSPGEAVLDAMRRNEPKTFAGLDDPSTLDRELRAERAEHTAVIATAPPDRREELLRAHERQDRAADDHHWATRGLILREDERASLGPLTRLRRTGRDDINRHDQDVADAHARLERAERELRDARLDTTRFEAAVSARASWDRQHGWRIGRADAIDRQLAHHWADVTRPCAPTTRSPSVSHIFAMRGRCIESTSTT